MISLFICIFVTILGIIVLALTGVVTAGFAVGVVIVGLFMLLAAVIWCVTNDVFLPRWVRNFLMIGAVLAAICGCVALVRSGDKAESVGVQNDGYSEIASVGNRMYIVREKGTDLMYLASRETSSYYNSICPLLNTDGTPRTYAQELEILEEQGIEVYDLEE